MQLAFSVDLEPNKDGSFAGVEAAMEWFDEVIPRGTVYATHRIATEVPGIVESLASNHEIGVHVHPREFGHAHDQLAELEPERQRELIGQTRDELAALVHRPIESFRAGRHSASEETLDVLADLGFAVDASVHVRYRDYLPLEMTTRESPWLLDNGVFEVPTTYVRPSLFSRVGLRVFPQRTVTATSTTVREDDRFCGGERAIAAVFDRSSLVSFYMHPYDATEYHDDLTNAGPTFRSRIERVLDARRDEIEFVTASDLRQRADTDAPGSGPERGHSTT